MLTVTRHSDGTHTVAGGEDVERFAVELFNVGNCVDDVLTYDRETGVVTIMAANDALRYRVACFDDWSLNVVRAVRCA